MLVEFIETFKTPILQAAFALLLALFLTFIKIPTLLLHGLNTYIQPENPQRQQQQQSGIKAAIRRPSSTTSSDSSLDGYQHLSSSSKTHIDGIKKRNKSKEKEKFEFDESKSQIFRLKLDDGHIKTRTFFADYWFSCVYLIVALSSFVLYWCYLVKVDGEGSNGGGVLTNGSLVLVMLGYASLVRVLVSLVKVSFEKSASKVIEKQMSVIFGVSGFVLGLVICSSALESSILDFSFGSVDGLGRICIASLMGWVAGLLYMPAGKNARSFWLGTDQVRSNLEMISCGWFGRTVLYVNFLVVSFTALLWIKPFSEMMININGYDSRGMRLNASVGNAEKLIGNVGFSRSDFVSFRLWCLLLSGIVQVVALRPNLQMYLNEALLSWYQRLHAGKVPDMDFSRAKVFLHNHYLCLAALQFIAPAILVLLLLCFSVIHGDAFESSHVLLRLLPIAFTKQVSLFMAWWVIFIWTAFTSSSILWYRLGFSYVS